MIEQPRISVGVPVYNGARWIAATAASILSQTETDLELILCDNASTDDTEAVCRQIAAGDSRVRYVRNEHNIGAPNNYNRCLELANGQYFKWNSSSDLCKPELLEKCIAVLDAHPTVAVVYSLTELLGENGIIVSANDSLELIDESPLKRFAKLTENFGLNHVMNGVMRRAMLNTTMLHQPFYSSDICLMAEISLVGKIVQLPEYLFVRRETLDTASHLQSRKDRQKYFDPQLKRKMLFQKVKLYRGYFHAVRRSPLSKAQKRALYVYLFKRMRWARYDLIHDVAMAVKKIFRRA